MTTRKELEACYRFFDNVKVTPQKILQPHIEATYQRIAETDFVVCAQDTSEVDLTRPNEQGVARGIVGQKTSVRKEISTCVCVVLCEGVNVPEGEDPICWMLVTTLPIETDDQVQRVIRTYCIRWQIELFFKTLKSGCRIEHRRFEEIHRIKNCLAFDAMAAWRRMYICHLGRECPDVDCEVVFEPSE